MRQCSSIVSKILAKTCTVKRITVGETRTSLLQILFGSNVLTVMTDYACAFNMDPLHETPIGAK
jgi:tRNA G37 N-methylase Trm5